MNRGVSFWQLGLSWLLGHVSHVILVHILFQIYQVSSGNHILHHLSSEVRKRDSLELLVFDHLLDHGEFHHLIVILHVLIDIHAVENVWIGESTHLDSWRVDVGKVFWNWEGIFVFNLGLIFRLNGFMD
jgi:hypothetical protein